jgi:NAD(P)-dependent dehydrogenase (short-subunit alcohol dehydrogenase family)
MQLLTAIEEIGEHVIGVSRGPKPESVGQVEWITVNDYEHFDPSGLDWSRAFIAFGSFLQSPLVDAAESDIVEQIRVDLTSQILIVKRLVGSVQSTSNTQRDIVLVGSTSSYTGFGGSSVYCASRFGLRGLVEAMNPEMTTSTLATSVSARPRGAPMCPLLSTRTTVSQREPHTS